MVYFDNWVTLVNLIYPLMSLGIKKNLKCALFIKKKSYRLPARNSLCAEWIHLFINYLLVTTKPCRGDKYRIKIRVAIYFADGRAFIKAWLDVADNQSYQQLEVFNKASAGALQIPATCLWPRKEGIVENNWEIGTPITSANFVQNFVTSQWKKIFE